MLLAKYIVALVAGDSNIKDRHFDGNSRLGVYFTLATEHKRTEGAAGGSSVSDLPTRRFESKLADLAEHVFALLGQLLHLWARMHFTGKTRQN